MTNKGLSTLGFLTFTEKKKLWRSTNKHIYTTMEKTYYEKNICLIILQYTFKFVNLLQDANIQ